MVHRESELKRIFIAINIPVQLREEIYNSVWKSVAQKGLKVVRAENLHLTIRFIGYLDTDALSEVLGKLKVFESEKRFDVLLSGAGHFKGKVLWIGVSEEEKELKAIAGKVNSLLGGEGDFSAHLTIARNKDLSKSEFDSVLEKVRLNLNDWKFRVKSVDVMESKLSGRGAEYSCVGKVLLKEG